MITYNLPAKNDSKWGALYNKPLFLKMLSIYVFIFINNMVCGTKFC